MDKAPVKEGEILAGKYKIERMLAKGGMGVVVAAMHEALEQRVALKFLLPEGAENADAVGRFLREARAAVRLRSEHVAKVLDVGTLDTGSPYIVMEYLEGRDLQAVLTERGKLSPQTAVSYVLQACEAIAEAHAHGIVHRDLKPGNLFLTRRNDGTPCIKVLDFGISKLPSGQLQGAMTKTATLMGTPYYISPEQLRSSKNADSRSDIWALGMILYELLSGSVAFPRETLPELCTAIIYDSAPDFRAHGVDIAPELVRVVMRCLEKAPENRYQTLAELAAALATFVSDGGASAERISRILDPKERAYSSVHPAAETKPGPTFQEAPVVDEPPVSIPIPLSSMLGAETRREGFPELEAHGFGEHTYESARLEEPALPPTPVRAARGPRMAIAGALGAAAAVIAVLWVLDSRRATAAPVAVTSSPVALATPPAPAEEKPPIVLAAEPAQPAVVAASAEEKPMRAVPPVPEKRKDGQQRDIRTFTHRSAEDEFGFRK